MLLRPAFDAFIADYVTTNAELGIREGLTRTHILPDCNRHRPLQTLLSLGRAWRVIRAVKPDFVVTTGALPGLLCVVIGRLLGAKCIWIDSIANSERASMSGWCARWFCAMSLTQWQHLARPGGPRYEGALL